VGSCGALWTISGFDARFFGISAGFFLAGNEAELGENVR
jgi:hypothetical protein